MERDPVCGMEVDKQTAQGDVDARREDLLFLFGGMQAGV